ncbi:AraC family transcriptional regulator ligand-binding domain-containing protein [Hoyosella sp. G463]|uniref:AraC family transcriptional regulator ligand-binding domain-containing protein n=2 Tax=Lolliginicoccus lacisalsi TaxID=2742202 RepID=A0A927JAW2_9ACTN|nr:AraC family transcriptional regulator ligand-binding domain-containing protein [Lolliginicoccus lacisalsi]
MVMAAAPAWSVPRGTEGLRIMAQGVTGHMTIAEVLSGTGLTEADLVDETAEIWEHQEFAVVRNIVGKLGDNTGQGIEVGGFSTFGRAGIVGFTFLASATVREGVERVAPYLALAPSHVRLSVDADATHSYIVADDTEIPADVRPFIVERDLAGIAAVLRGAGVELAPEWIETTLDEERAERLVRTWSATAEIRPNQSRNRIAGPPEMLDVPLPQADPNTARLFERQCAEVLGRRLARVGLAGQIRSRLLNDPAHFPSMQTVADELHLDPRTLRRRLTDEGTSFRALVEDVRCTLAERLLAQDMPIEAIAHRLGYAETASFTHAFTRWTGVAPSRSRARNRRR